MASEATKRMAEIMGAEFITRPAPEYAGLVERLREQGNRAAKWYRPDDAATCDEAATALTALSERNKALEVERLRGGTGDTRSNVPIVRPSQPDNDSVWYRGWEAGYDDTAARYVKECWVAYEGGCDLDAPHITASSWDDLLDEIDAALGDRP